MKRFDEINVIPLIDVMLVLLAVVLTTASFIVHDSLKLDLPETESTEQYKPPEEKTINFAINAKGELFIDEELTGFDQLKGRVAEIKPKTPLIIKVDDKAEFGRFIDLIDVLKTHNLTNLTFLTDKVKAS